MIGRARRIAQIVRTVADLDRAERFYVEALGFTPLGRAPLEPQVSHALGARSGERALLGRGEQRLALQRLDPPAWPYPADDAATAAFQHIALPDPAIRQTVATLPPGTVPISIGGPQRLPASSGGVTAYKFRDPDQLPLELIAFPDGHAPGIDHSAIVVADALRSIAFYRDQLGLRVAARQRNTGPEQDRLDGIQDAAVDVVALEPAIATPHLELLAYRQPAVRPAPPHLLATILTLELDSFDGPVRLIRDPDDHPLLLVPPA